MRRVARLCARRYLREAVKTLLLRLAGPLVGITLFVLAVAVLRRELQGENVRDIVRDLSAIPPQQLALAVVLTGLSFLALTGYDALAVRYVRKRVPLKRVALTSFITYAFSQALGFPLLTGGSVRFRLYTACGLSPIQITVAGYLWWTVLGGRIIRLGGWRFVRPSPALAVRQLALASIDWALAGSVLFALLPPGIVSFPGFLGIFLVAFVAGIVSHVPGGLGVFESIVLLLLGDRLDESVLLGTLIAYRAIYNLLPPLVAAALLGLHELMPTRVAPSLDRKPVRLDDVLPPTSA